MHVYEIGHVAVMLADARSSGQIERERDSRLETIRFQLLEAAAAGCQLCSPRANHVTALVI
jgi:hypothetical protein